MPKVSKIKVKLLQVGQGLLEAEEKVGELDIAPGQRFTTEQVLRMRRVAEVSIKCQGGCHQDATDLGRQAKLMVGAR